MAQGLHAEAASSWNLHWGAVGELPGKQTVNRGELWALKAFLLATGRRPAIFITDSAYVMRGFKKIKLGNIPKTNKALWMEMKAIIQGRDIVLIKMESHLNYQEALGRGHSTLAWVANSLADGLAEFASERSQFSLQHVDRVKLGDSMATLIRVRCMAVLLDVMEKDPPFF